MVNTSLASEIAGPSANLGAIADRVARQAALLTEVFTGLSAATPKIRYGCLKVLRMISEKKPAVLYPAFDQFVERQLRNRRNAVKRKTNAFLQKH